MTFEEAITKFHARRQKREAERLARKEVQDQDRQGHTDDLQKKDMQQGKIETTRLGERLKVADD